MDKNEVLLFIAERLDQITMMEQGRYSGKITREEQKLYQEAWSYIDPKAKVCFTCGRTPQLMSLALLNYYQCQQEQTESGVTETKPKMRRRSGSTNESTNETDYHVKRSENYGLYITQNTYQMKWYCFDREAANAYWNGKPCKKAVGETPQEALSNYKNGLYCNK